MSEKQKIKFKTKEVEQDYDRVHPALKDIIEEIADYVFKKVPVIITITEGATTLEQDLRIGRSHAVHRELRGVDVRNSNLPIELQRDLVDKFNDKYKQIGAVSIADGQSRLIVRKSDHLHIQLRRGLEWKPLKDLLNSTTKTENSSEKA